MIRISKCRVAGRVGGIAAVLLLQTWIVQQGRAKDAKDAPVGEKRVQRVESLYPGLCAGLLCQARVGTLRSGVILHTDRFDVTRKMLNDLMEKTGPWLRDEYARFALPLLEQHAERMLLEAIGRERLRQRTGTGTTGAGKPGGEPPEEDLIEAGVESIAGGVTVADPAVRAFYERNARLFGGAHFDEVRTYIRQTLTQRAKDEAVRRFFREYPTSHLVEIDGKWLRSAAAKALENPVDRLRGNGSPLLVAFSADTGCTACCGGRETETALDVIGEELGGRVQTYLVDLREAPGLGLRFRIREVPTWLLFDGEGGEVLRVEGQTSPGELLQQVRHALPAPAGKDSTN